MKTNQTTRTFTCDRCGKHSNEVKPLLDKYMYTNAKIWYWHLCPECYEHTRLSEEESWIEMKARMLACATVLILAIVLIYLFGK